MSPDALTGMEANLRFNGPENMFTRVFGRLTAWQNWIFQRPNAVGEKGALKVYGKGEKAAFDWQPRWARAPSRIDRERSAMTGSMPANEYPRNAHEHASTTARRSPTTSTWARTARCSARSSSGSRTS